ncbi:hypothetical protein B0D71_00835 [Pseudomonas laurylsulfativorans]|uniref:Uncharacterized protein n=1 Tax=Pseudomonas laurylsulfativorans TaxID=1943631 RepID=A0A2S3VTX9_9PSED|nr:hypothetical protein B0D71_00835 [Pseudomonas laurylsulfativorans]
MSLVTRAGIASSVMPGLKVSTPDWMMEPIPSFAFFAANDRLTVIVIALASLRNTVSAALVPDGPTVVSLAWMAGVAMLKRLECSSLNNFRAGRTGDHCHQSADIFIPYEADQSLGECSL